MGGGDTLIPAGQKAVNQLGLLDMSGDVWEWCFTASGSDRVTRGGSWDSSSEETVVSWWIVSDPDSTVGNDIGFRFARTQ